MANVVHPELFAHSTPDQREGILDGEVWRSINGGIDSYYAFKLAIGMAGIDHYHGYLGFNSDVSFYPDQPMPNATDRDLYSTALHEAMHIIGFSSLFNRYGHSYFDAFGDPLVESIYYTRFDQFINKGAGALILDPLACDWNSSVQFPVDLTIPNCGVYFTGPNSGQQYLYSPSTWFQGSSCSHLDEACSGTQFLMAPDNGYGERQIVSQTEADMLSDIGYRTRNNFGDPMSGWAGAYAARTVHGSRFAGVDDIFADYATKEFYTIKQGEPAIVLNHFLQNDEAQSGVGGVPDEFACLTVLQGGGTASVLSASSFSYLPAADFTGWAIIRYVPRSSLTSEVGNFTYIYVDVRPADVCGSEPCNILNGGDFETLRFSTVGSGSYHNWLISPAENHPDIMQYVGSVNAWYTSAPSYFYGSSLDHYTYGCPSGLHDVAPGHGGPGNSTYVSCRATNGTGIIQGLRFELCQPLIPGSQYLLDYWVYDQGYCGQDWVFKAAEARPCNQAQGQTDVTGALNTCGPQPFHVVDIVPTQALSGGGWQHITKQFIYDADAAPGTWLLAFEDQPTGETASFLDDVKIHPLITVTPTITVDCNGGFDGTINLEVHYYDGEYDIQWSNGATTANISDLAPGDYTVTITDNTLGCASFTQTYTVSEGECCPADRVIHDGDMSSAIGTYFTGTVDIQGQFIVDENTEFDQAQVFLEAGAEIIVRPDVTLGVSYSTLESCQNRMWKTITAEHGSVVYIKESTVEDAENVLTALDGSTIMLVRNEFRDNRNSLFVPPASPGQWNDVSVYMNRNLFTSTGALAQPYPGQSTALGHVGYAAVDVHNTFTDLTGGDNVIDRMSNGIIGHRSDLDVTGFIIKNVQPDVAYAYGYSGNGSGIFAQGDHGYFKLGQQGYGMGNTPSFENCDKGIYTRYMTVFSENNNMQNVGIAYHVERSGSRYVDIKHNQLHTLYHGIDLLMNEGAARVRIQSNDITFGDAAFLFWNYPCIGIYVSEAYAHNPDSKILNNTIHFVPKNTSATGIGLLSTEKWLVAENELIMTSNVHNRTGIATKGARGCEVSCNNITGAGTTYPIDGQAGITNFMGESQQFSCNVVDRTANGILFNGVAYGTDLRGNQFNRHRWGLHLSANAIIDAQQLKGNLWYNEPPQGGWGAYYEPMSGNEPNPNAGAFPFRYDPANISGGNTEPPSWWPLEWFQQDYGVNYDCADDHGTNYCDQFYAEREKAGIQNLDQRIAQDSLQNNPYTEESKYMLKGGLYKKLDEDPSLRDSVPAMADFYAALQGSTTAAFKAMDDSQLALYDLDSTVVDQLQTNRAQIEGLMDSVKTGMVQLDDSTLTEAQKSAIIAGISGYRSVIGNLTAWNTTALLVAATSKVLTAEGIRTANANIGTTELIESNEKLVNEIYLAVIGKDVDTFTVDQSTTLFYIADQCPMVGGNAVYKARAIYRLINDTISFDDQQLCLPHGIIVKSLKPMDANVVGVMPNPARDGATLVLEQPLEIPADFILYNMVGSVVLRVEIPADADRTAFSTASIAAGMYHYKVISATGVAGSGKLSIIH